MGQGVGTGQGVGGVQTGHDSVVGQDGGGVVGGQGEHVTAGGHVVGSGGGGLEGHITGGGHVGSCAETASRKHIHAKLGTI